MYIVQYSPAPCKLTFDLLILKVASESRVTCATSVPILVVLDLSVLDLGPMYTWGIIVWAALLICCQNSQ